MAEDVVAYLTSKGVFMKRGGLNEVHVPCFFHGEDPGKRGRLYINTDPNAAIPGLFMCHVCGEHGSLVSIMRHFGDEVQKTPAVEMGEHQHAILETAATYYHDRLADEEDIFAYLRHARGLDIETIVEAKLGYADGHLYRHLRSRNFTTKDILATGLCVDGQSGIVDSLVNMITIPYHVTGNVVMIRGRARPDDHDGPKYKTPARQDTRLFNSGVTWGAEEILIAEGEFDALVLNQLGFAAVGSAGANVWQDSWDGYLADAKRIYVVFDSDESGEKGFDKLKDRFGPRVRRITIPGEGGDADVTEWVVTRGHTADDFRVLIAESMKGGLLITVAEARVEHTSVQGQSGLKFNMEDLDAAITPGLLPAQICVPLAKSGTGKTIFLLNVMQRMTMHPAQKDVRFLFVSLEQTRGEWFERARRIHRFYNLTANDDDCERYWEDRLMLVDKNRMTEGELVNVLDDYEYRIGAPPQFIALDYLGYWANSFKGDRYERTSDAVMSLKAIAKEKRLFICAPHQVSRVVKYGEEPDGDVARDAGVIEETADFVFVLWNQDDLLGRSQDNRIGEVHLKITKSRHGGRGTKLIFKWGPISLVMVPPRNSRYHALAHNELRYDNIRDPWEITVDRHRGLLPSGEAAMKLERVPALAVADPLDIP